MNQGGLLLVSCIVLVAIDSCLSLRCLKCSGIDKASCEKSQTIETCSEKEPICIRLTYSDKIETKGVAANIVSKKCSTNKFGCNMHCSDLWKNCKVSCCEEDMCNADQKDKVPTVWAGNKRSFSDSDSKSSSIQASCNIIFVAASFRLLMSLAI